MREKRQHQRFPLSCTVTCQTKAGETFQAESRDISLGGMYLVGEQRMSFGTELTIIVKLPHFKDELELPGVVRWYRPGGFGVQFGLLGAQETHVLTHLQRYAGPAK